MCLRGVDMKAKKPIFHMNMKVNNIYGAIKYISHNISFSGNEEASDKVLSLSTIYHIRCQHAILQLCREGLYALGGDDSYKQRDL